MHANWLTPEEVELKRKRNKIILYVSLPTITIVVSGIITYFLGNL